MINEFIKIEKVKIGEEILPQTRKWLFKAGINHDEAFVLWAGLFNNYQEFIVTTTIYPKQKSLHTINGVGVYVDGEELFKINKWLYENKLILFAQVHSHPTEAYHSNTDDNFPLVNAKGQFSIVIPYYAGTPKIDLTCCAIYRLNNNGIWDAIQKDIIKSIFEVR
jgi:hypothetical protein